MELSYVKPASPYQRKSWLGLIFNYGTLNIYVVFFLLFYGAMKDDTATTLGSEFWGDLKWSPLVLYLKKFSFISLALLAVTAGYFMARSRKFVIGSNICGWLLWSELAYAAARTLFEGSDADIKIVIGSFIQLAILIYFNIAITNIGTIDKTGHGFYDNATKGIYYFSAFLVLVNLFNVVTGNGFVPGNPRLFGTSSHPNFLGVQLGISLAATIYYGVFMQKWAGRIFSAIVLLSGLYLLYLTGSRTGIIVFVVASSVGLWSRTGFRVYYPAVLGAIAICLLPLIISVSMGMSSSGSSFARAGDANTRAIAWDYLLSIIQEKPMFGLGHFVVFSENSLLRGWASYGAPFALIFTMLFFYAIYMGGKQLLQRRLNNHVCLMFGLLFGLAVGSMLEGYLVDLTSPQISIWYICVVCLGEPLTRIKSTGGYLRS